MLLNYVAIRVVCDCRVEAVTFIPYTLAINFPITVQTLCKQGDWFLFAKRRAPSPRHLNAVIDDPRPATGSFNMADVRHLSAHVIKLRDMPEGVLVLSGLRRVWKSRVCDLALRGADGNVMGIHDFLCLLEWTGTEDLAVGTPSSKIVAKAEASQKRKASTSGAISSYVAKRTRSALPQSSSSTTRPSLFVGDDDESDDDDDDVCVKILLVTPLCSTVVIPSSGNQGRSSATPTAEGSNPRDSSGKGIMVDDAATPSDGASRLRPSFRPAPSFRNVFGDATHMDFFPFPPVLIMPLILRIVLLGIMCLLGRSGMLHTGLLSGLSDDQLAAKMSVLHCMMMSHGGELLACYREMNQSHHEYVLSTDSRLKGYEEKVASLSGLELQVCALKKQVSGLNDKLSSSDAYFAKSKAKGKERKKKIKSLTKSIDNFHTKVVRLSVALNQDTILEVEKDEKILRLKDTPPEFSSFFHGQLQGLDRIAEASPLVAQTDYAFLNKIFEHATEPLSVILQLKPEKLVRPANIPALREARVFPPTKESIVTPASKSLEFSANVNFTASSIAPEHNEEMVNAEVDGSGPKMTDDTVAVKSRHAFVQGISVALDDAIELVKVGSGRVSSSPNDVVVALSGGEKGDGLDPSYAACEEAAANPSGV
ncbi:hypothetical protein Tco_1082775 [Tanacetum coccineum]|uniref:Uncharacterized protein n=1 Tax=Tanacetum coccineum TaxID=301880 RepID=A0ABQ5I2U9_9ASTR